jgi:hypothetical protein
VLLRHAAAAREVDAASDDDRTLLLPPRGGGRVGVGMGIGKALSASVPLGVADVFVTVGPALHEFLPAVLGPHADVRLERALAAGAVPDVSFELVRAALLARIRSSSSSSSAAGGNADASSPVVVTDEGRADIRDTADDGDDLGRSTAMASVRLEPDILYQYPDHTATVKSPLKVLPTKLEWFCFPSGIELLATACAAANMPPAESASFTSSFQHNQPSYRERGSQTPLSLHTLQRLATSRTRGDSSSTASTGASAHDDDDDVVLPLAPPAPSFFSFVTMNGEHKSFGVCVSFYVPVMNVAAPCATTTQHTLGASVSTTPPPPPPLLFRCWAPLCLCFLTSLPVVQSLHRVLYHVVSSKEIFDDVAGGLKVLPPFRHPSPLIKYNACPYYSNYVMSQPF